MDMEKPEKEIPKPKTKAEAHPVTKSETKVKDEPKSETKTDKTSDSMTELVTRVYELYKKLGRGDDSAVLNMDETQLEVQKPEDKAEPKPEVKAGHQQDTKAKTKSKIKTEHQNIVKAKPKPGSKK